MKKHLLGTTALVAAGMLGMAGAAQAQPKPVQVTVGGYHGQWVGWWNESNIYGAGNGKRIHVDQQNESEIHFNGRTTLENGITVGFRVELEAATEGDQIDESYMFIEGKFGRIELGALNNVAYRMHYSAPDAHTRGWLQEGNLYNWVTNATNSPSFNSQFIMTSLRFYDNDSEKINYYTPRFAGFQLGVSYIPEASQDITNAPARNTAVGATSGAGYQRGFAAGANYVREFGPWNVAASVGYMHWNVPDNSAANTPDPDAYSAGLRVGYGGFSVGGSWSRISGGRVATAGQGNANTTQIAFANARRLQGHSWEVGARYTWGPAAVSINYFQSRNDSNLITSGLSDKDEFSAVALAGRYTLGPGVTLEAVATHGRFETGNGNPSTVNGRTGVTKNEFTGVIAGVLLIF